MLTIQSFVDAGIPPGPWIRQLHLGQSVTLPDGRKIDPHQLKRDGFYKGTTYISNEITLFCKNHLNVSYYFSLYSSALYKIN